MDFLKKCEGSIFLDGHKNTSYFYDIYTFNNKGPTLFFKKSCLDNGVHFNISEAAKTTITLDTVIPEAPLLTAPSRINSVNQTEYRISGNTEANAFITVIVSDGYTHKRLETISDQTGEFTLKENVSDLNDGPITLEAYSVDSIENEGKRSSIQVEKDTVAPAELTLSIGEVVTKQNVTAFKITGTSTEEGGIVSIEASDGNDVVHESALVDNGAFSIPVNLEKLSDGELIVSVKVKDSAGNEGPVQTFSLTKDVTSNVPIVTKSKLINQADELNYMLEGMAELGSTIELIAYGQTGTASIQETVIVAEDGNFTISADFSEIKGESPFILLKQVDTHGNESEQMITSVTSYVVGSGDTLWKIANQFQTTINEVMQMNQLTNSMIYVGQELKIPSVAGISMSVIPEEQAFNMGYLYFGNSKIFTETVAATKGTINVVAPTYFDLNADGTLKLTSLVDRHFIANMQANGIRVVPFLSNHWDQQIANNALDNREQLATQLAEAIELYNLDGVNVDIENASPEYRDAYTDFIRLLREKLPVEKEVSTAVGAKIRDTNTGWQAVYDYQRISPNSDYLMLMSYDESYVGSKPGPIASIGFVESAIQYAINSGVPKEKIVMGIGHYGRYWQEGAAIGGYGISNQQVKEAIALYNGTVTFDESSQSPNAVFTIHKGDPQMSVYGSTLTPGTYTIWFENEQSIKAKLDLVEKYGIKGTGNWGMAQETPEFWDAMAGWMSESEAVGNETNN